MEDPICGMDVDPDEATRLGLISNFQGAPFFFCSPECKQTFDRDPRAAVTRRPGERAMPADAPRDDARGRPRGMHRRCRGRCRRRAAAAAARRQMPTPTTQMPAQMPAAGHAEGTGRRPPGGGEGGRPRLPHGGRPGPGPRRRAVHRAQGRDLVLLHAGVQAGVRRRPGGLPADGPMIDRVVDFSVRNKLVVFAAVARRRARRLVVHRADAARRHPRPLRHPGHRLLPLGPLARPRGGPGHLPDRDRDARRPRGAGGARLLGLRLLLRLRDLRGRDRHLLGALAHARVPLAGHPVAPRRREDRARPRRARPRLGLPVRARRRDGQAQPRRPALAAGLVPALPPARPSPAWPRSPRSAATRSSTR